MAAQTGLVVAAVLLVASGTALVWARRKRSQGPGSAGPHELAVRSGH